METNHSELENVSITTTNGTTLNHQIVKESLVISYILIGREHIFAQKEVPRLRWIQDGLQSGGWLRPAVPPVFFQK